MDQTILDKYHILLNQAAINLDWDGYQAILKDYQRYYLDNDHDWDYPGRDNLLHFTVMQQPDSPVATANQVNIIRHLLANQALQDPQLFPVLITDRRQIFTAACQFGSVSAVKMLLAAGCGDSKAVRDLLTDCESNQVDFRLKIAKLVILISQDHLDFSRILLGLRLHEISVNEKIIRNRLHRLDDPKLNRLVLCQGMELDLPEYKLKTILANLAWCESINLRQALIELGKI